MQNLPKIVVKRLQSPAAESHPDADLLTAFAEQSLTGTERDQLVEHLARCGDCREVVSLALPPQLEVQPLAASSANWFSWALLRTSGFRWAAVAAGVVLIASIGVLQYRSQRPRELASNLSQPKEAIATPAQSSQPASQMAVPQTQIQDEKAAAPQAQTALSGNKATPSEGANFRPQANAAVAIHGAGDAIGSTAGRSFNAQSFHGSAFAGAPAKPAPTVAGQSPVPAPPPQTVEVAAASPTVEAQSVTVDVAGQPATQDQIHGQLMQSETAEQSADRVAKAKAASALVSTAMAPPSLHSAPLPMKGVPPPRWTISASGVLQRSVDGGHTWLDVDVAANASTTSDLLRRTKVETTVEVTAEATTALTSEAQSDAASPAPSNPSVNARSLKKQSAPAAPLIFRALSVSSNAAEVWAGGSGGALYHTLDGGNRWARVVPSVARAILTGDVLSIQFSDSRVGTVTTSTSEVWTTSDAGQTWHKQP
jgi:Photosynthesis system II assembly factor YCF48/Putative zinc-finger